MASDYGFNFGFRRSDESMRSGTEGRQRVPATGTYKQGDLVTFDPANPGYIKKAAADSPLLPGFTGLIIQEDAWIIPLNGNQIVSTMDLDIVHNDAQCAIWTGAGLKVWMKNTPATANRGQRARSAINKFTGTGLAIGELIGWDGTVYRRTTDPTLAVARVTLYNGSDYLEATLIA